MVSLGMVPPSLPVFAPNGTEGSYLRRDATSIKDPSDFIQYFEMILEANGLDLEINWQPGPVL